MKPLLGSRSGPGYPPGGANVLLLHLSASTCVRRGVGMSLGRRLLANEPIYVLGRRDCLAFPRKTLKLPLALPRKSKPHRAIEWYIVSIIHNTGENHIVSSSSIKSFKICTAHIHSFLYKEVFFVLPGPSWNRFDFVSWRISTQKGTFSSPTHAQDRANNMWQTKSIFCYYTIV